MPSSRASEAGRRAEGARERTADAPPRAEDAQERDAGAPGGDGEAQERDLAAEVERLEDRHRRALADLDNYRKRSSAEIDRRVAESREALLREWLESLDSIERALLMAEPGSPLAAGLQAVLEQMEVLLERQGVQRVGTVGERFDPERHEAVARVPANDVPDLTVVEIVRSGFALDGRVLRPARVVVAQGQERED
jgi:molecular chaperone GrpE